MEEKKERQSRSRSIALIENLKARRVTYKKRSNCVKKKTSELATLCGVDAFTVIFGPDGEVDTWPENRSDAIAVLKAFHTKKAEHETKKTEYPSKKPENDEDWVRGLSRESLTELLGVLESKIGAIDERMRMLRVAREEQSRATEVITTQSRPHCFDHDHGVDHMFDAQMAFTTLNWPLDCFVDHRMIDAPISYGVDPFAVFFERDSEIETWSESHSEATAVLKAFQTKKAEHRPKKTEYPSKKPEKAENDEDWVRGLSRESLTELLGVLGSKIGAIDERMKMLGASREEQSRATEVITTQSLPHCFDHDHGVDHMFDAQMASTTPTLPWDCFVDHHM